VAVVAQLLGLAEPNATRLPEFRALSADLFEHFPHRSAEASVAATGSEAESTLLRGVASLDVALCGVATLFLLEGTGDMSAAVEAARSYLTQCLESHISEIEADALRRQGKADAEAEADERMKVVEVEEEEEEDDEDDDEEDDDEEEEEEEEEQEPEQEDAKASRKSSRHSPSAAEVAARLVGHTDEADHARRLYSCLEALVLAADASTTSSSSSGGDQVVTAVLDQLLRLLSSARSSPRAVGRQVLLRLVRPALSCLCGVALHPDLLCGGASASTSGGGALGRALLRALIESVALLPRWPGEPAGPFSSLVLRALLAVLRRVGFSKSNAQDEDEDEDEEEEEGKGAVMDEEASVRAAVCRCVLGLFCDSVVFGASSASTATTGEPSKQAGAAGTTMYEMCGREQRRLMLGLFHYAPWGRNAVPAAAAAASKAVCRALCGANPSRSDASDTTNLGSGELDYFLRVLHEHRAAFALQGFVDQLLATGRAAVAALSAKAGLGPGSTQAAALERAALLSRAPPLRWHAHCVADALLRCSSSETPEKIAALLAAPLSAWLDSASASSAPGGGSSSGQQWLKRSATTSAVLAVSIRLLQPCSMDKSSSLIEVAARAALFSVLSAGTAGDARLLSSALDALESMPSIFDAFLVLCSTTPHDALLPSLRLLIVLHPIFAAKNRENLRGCIASGSGGGPQQEEILQLLARV